MTNLLAVFVCAVVAMVIGSVWYSPMLFANIWMKESGITAADMEAAKKKGMGKSYALQFVAAVVTMYVLALFARYAGVQTITGGAWLGFLAWLGFYAATTTGAVAWEARSWKWWLLMNGHSLLMLLVTSAILGVWR